MKKQILKKLSVLGMVLALSVSGLMGCGKTSSQKENISSADNQLTTIRYGVMTGNNEHILALVGIDQGIYQKHGINLELTEFSTGVEAIGAVTTGELEMAEVMDFGGINRLGQTASDTNLRILAQNYVEKEGVGATRLYVNPEKVSSLEDIKGKKLSVSIGTQNEYFDAKLLESRNLTEDDVEMVPIQSIQDTVAIAQRGDIDIVWSGSQFADKLEDLGWKSILNAEDIGLRNRNLAIGSEEFAKNVDVVSEYYKARQEVVEYIDKHEDEVADFIADKLGITAEQFKAQYDSYSFEAQYTDDVENSLNELILWSVNKGNFESFNLDSVVNTDGLKKAFPDKVK